MLKDILHIIGSRYIVAFLGLLLILINAKVLGLEGVGTIGLIWASINIIAMINSVLSTNTIVYFTHKYPIRSIYPISFVWIFIGTSFGAFVLNMTGLLPAGYEMDIFLITILYSLPQTNARFLLSKDRINSFNLTNVVQGGLLFFVLIYFYYVLGQKEVSAYIWGLYITNGVAMILSFILLFVALKDEKASDGPRTEKSFWGILKEMFVYGLWGSADNLAEVCTARLNYFILERFAGLASVGLLDVGTKISESVWNISKSVAYIEYNQVAKESDIHIQKRVTLRLFKLTFCVVAFVMGCILLIPEWVYTEYLFSADFTGVRKVVVALAVGIIALAGNSIFSHYFIGSGRIRYSTFSSCIGLITLLIFGYVLIPLYGVVGSAISTSIAFTAMLTFSLTVFARQTRSSLKDFIPNKEDYLFVRELIRRKRV